MRLASNKATGLDKSRANLKKEADLKKAKQT
jgi:hypothetical protein